MVMMSIKVIDPWEAIKLGRFIKCSQVSSIATTNLGVVAVECTLPNHTKWPVACCYRPPTATKSLISDLLPTTYFLVTRRTLLQVISTSQILPGKNSHYTSLGTLGQHFCDILDDYFMPHLELIIDLVISNQHEHVSIIDTCDPSEFGMSSDHKIIRFEFSTSTKPVLSNRRLFYDYKRANFDELRHRKC